MRILMTGVSSFTGSHIARALRQSGHEILSVRAHAVGSRGELEAQRLDWAGVRAHPVPAPFGSEAFLAAVDSFRPEVILNHGADIDGYRRADFDFRRSMAASFLGIEELLTRLNKVGCRYWIHSGSIFESDEGSSDDNTSQVGRTQAMSLYGASRAAVWQILRFIVPQAGLKMIKIVIPNPVGPFENSDRLVPVFVKRWLQGEECVLKSADAVRDFIPAPWLARVYAEALSKQSAEAISVLRPSAWVLTQEAFVRKVQLGLGRYLPPVAHGVLKCEPSGPGEIYERFNMEPVLELRSTSFEQELFESWAQALSSSGSAT